MKGILYIDNNCGALNEFQGVAFFILEWKNVKKVVNPLLFWCSSVISASGIIQLT